MDTTELEAAYRAVLDLAATPGPGSVVADRGSGGAGQAAGAADPAPDEADPAAHGAGRSAGGGEEAWEAEEVLAHLVLNDRLLARAVRSVLDGAAQPYDNAEAIDPARLRELSERLGTAGLVPALEASSRELLELAGRLDQAEGDTQLPVMIVDGGEVFLDRPVPVAQLLGIQARAHLPMHERQLGELLGRP